jgi:probable addiction module antidote protein
MPKTRTIPWDTAGHLDIAAEIAACQEAAFKDGDSAVSNHALGAAARAKDMAKTALQTGTGRQSL